MLAGSRIEKGAIIMTVHDIYFELNRFNKANLRQDGLQMPDFIDEYNCVSKQYFNGSGQRFLLIGINSKGQIFSNGFSNKGRRIRLEYKWRQEAECRYFFVCRERRHADV